MNPVGNPLWRVAGSKTARLAVVLGGVSLAVLAGAGVLFTSQAGARLERLAEQVPAGCHLTYDGRTTRRGPGRVTLVLLNPGLFCTPAEQPGGNGLFYTAARADLTVSAWAPSGLGLRIYGMRIVQAAPSSVARSLLSLEGEPVEVFLPHALAKGAGHGVVRAAFVQVLPFGFSLRGLDGTMLWNTAATPRDSAGGLAFSARQVVVPVGAMPGGLAVFEHVQAAFSLPGSSGGPPVPQAATGKTPLWPPLLVQRLSGEWRGVPLSVTGHVLGGDLASPSGDFWLTLHDVKSLARLLHPQGAAGGNIVSQSQREQFEAALDRLASRTAMGDGTVTLPLMLRAGDVRLGTLPVSLMLSALRAASPEPAALSGSGPAHTAPSAGAIRAAP
ncbi:MAG: DUF2125 domain-containing protein [Acetobacter sp.]|uniref:hypothetical protein n=1 Tax=Acetobacter sp. TaxID=440 RepID=UPI0039EB41B9